MQKDPQNRKENIKSSLIKLSLFLQKKNDPVDEEI